MKVKDFDDKGATVEFSIDELDVLRNGLNEARLLLSSADFQTRMGLDVEEVTALIKALQSLMTSIDERSGHKYSQPRLDERAKLTG